MDAAIDIYASTEFDSVKAERFCQLLAEGDLESDGTRKRLHVSQICEKLGMNSRMLRLWLDRYPIFQRNFEIAKELYADRLMEEALDIADNNAGDIVVRRTEKAGKRGTKEIRFESPNAANVNRAKLQVETRIKIASKLYPARYGDKLEINSTSKITHIDETGETLKLKARNLFEEFKKRGGTMRELFQEIGLTEVNLLAEDYKPYTAGAAEQMLEAPMTVHIPTRNPFEKR